MFTFIPIPTCHSTGKLAAAGKDITVYSEKTSAAYYQETFNTNSVKDDIPDSFINDVTPCQL